MINNNYLAICTVRKLKVPFRTTTKEDGVAFRAFSSLVDDVESLCLVKECRELEERYKVNYTSEILTAELEDRHPIIKEMIQIIHKKDLAHQLKSASNLEHRFRIAETVEWKKLWDHVLDHGEACNITQDSCASHESSIACQPSMPPM